MNSTAVSAPKTTNSFCAPCCMNISATTMRIALRKKCEMPERVPSLVTGRRGRVRESRGRRPGLLENRLAQRGSHKAHSEVRRVIPVIQHRVQLHDLQAQQLP